LLGHDPRRHLIISWSGPILPVPLDRGSPRWSFSPRLDHAQIGRRGKADDATTRMKPQPEPSTQEVLAGLIERVTYHSEENGFCVLRIKARGHRELRAGVAGQGDGIMGPAIGEFLRRIAA
jgi:hypothetical protein